MRRPGAGQAGVRGHLAQGLLGALALKERITSSPRANDCT